MRRLVWLVAAGLLLVVLLVVVDRVGEGVAETMVADQIDSELAANGVPADPSEVSVDRAPFLTQVLAGRYHSITVQLRNVRSDELELAEVDLVATGVSAPVGTLISREGEIVADRIEGTTTIEYPVVAELADVAGLEYGGLELQDVELAGGDDGLLQVRVPAELLQVDVVLVGAAEVTAVDGAVRLEVASLELAEPTELPPGADSLVEQAAQQLSLTVPLPPLPYGLTVDEVTPRPAGLEVAVSGEQVTLAQLND